MVTIQRILQLSWLVACVPFVRWAAVHHAWGTFALLGAVWSAMLIGTALLLLGRRQSFVWSFIPSAALAGIVGVWATVKIVAFFSGSVHFRDSPGTVLAVLIYLLMAGAPTAAIAVLAWRNRSRDTEPAPEVVTG